MSRDSEYYTVSEAAQVLEVSEATVWRWVSSERLPAFRVGPRRIRIRKSDLDLVIRPVQPKEAAAVDRNSVDQKQAPDLWTNYDPERVRAVIRQSAGVLKGLDRDAFFRELREARAQNSQGRPE